MKKTACFIILIFLANCVLVAEGKTSKAYLNAKVIYTGKGTRQSAISRVVQNYISRNSADAGKVRITETDVQGVWAHVWAEPVKRNTDNVQLLLRKQGRNWKVLVMGTSLFGTGKQFGVPVKLRKKWNL